MTEMLGPVSVALEQRFSGTPQGAQKVPGKHPIVSVPVKFTEPLEF